MTTVKVLSDPVCTVPLSSLDLTFMCLACHEVRVVGLRLRMNTQRFAVCLCIHSHGHSVIDAAALRITPPSKEQAAGSSSMLLSTTDTGSLRMPLGLRAQGASWRAADGAFNGQQRDFVYVRFEDSDLLSVASAYPGLEAHDIAH